ncbi:MAG: galactose ABC transporter substrate-binding protein [Oscillospiraceae bacterium]|nr:galactose ABC transporter substrate-binding protein [Oscillospiraceae bacterium]
MKKIVAILLTLLMVLSFAACSAKSGDDAEAGTADKEYNVGILIYDFANDYMSYVRAGMALKFDELGVNYEIVDGKGDQATQNDQMDTLIAKGVDLIIWAPMETEANQTLIDKCKAADIPCIINNKPPTTEGVMESYDTCWYVGVSTKQPGVCQAEMIVEDWNNNPEMDKNGDGILQYVFLLGQKGHQNAEDRYTGMNEVFDAQGIKREELDLQEAGWNTANAKDVTDAWLMKYGDSIEAIISNNDAMALGAIEACKAVGYFGDDDTLQMPIYGVNALQSALPEVVAGTLKGTVMTDMITEGKVCAQLAYNVLTGAELLTGIDYPMTSDKKIFVDGIAIRADNVSVAEDMYAAVAK